MCQRKRYHGACEEHIQKSTCESEGISEESEERVRARYPSLVQLLLSLHQCQDYMF